MMDVKGVEILLFYGFFEKNLKKRLIFIIYRYIIIDVERETQRKGKDENDSNGNDDDGAFR